MLVPDLLDGPVHLSGHAVRVGPDLLDGPVHLSGHAVRVGA